MDTRFKAAMAILTAAVLAGVWLFLAPFLVDYQPVGTDWTTATTHHVATGAVLAAASLTALLCAWALALRSIHPTPATEPDDTRR